ncbi:MAG: hypothetical protein EPN30_07875 [Actinomycetota bacterium]|nr:MAG: hypothetical protein EPN30_07875 [Actinomycetota bacterium]
MRNSQKNPAKLLRWYPRAWRQRYGAEFINLMEDSLEGRHPTLRFRFSIAIAGILERGHSAGIIGDGGTPADRARAGSLLVLCAWSTFLFAAASFAKLSEHFNTKVPQDSRSLIGSIYSLTVLLGLASSALVLAGAAIAVPAFIAYLKNNGWRTFKVHLARALLVSSLLIAATAALSFWAHHLSHFQRNGGDWLYSLTFLSWALLVAIATGLWIRAIVAAAAHFKLSARNLRIEGLFAEIVAILVIAASLSTATWWAAMRIYAPQFFTANRMSTASSPFDPSLIITMALMLAAVVGSGYGTMRIRNAATIAAASNRN